LNGGSSRLPINSLDRLSPVLITERSSTTNESNPDVVPSLQSANQSSLFSTLNRSLSSFSTYDSLNLTLVRREGSLISYIGCLWRMCDFNEIRVLTESVDRTGWENDWAAGKGRV
jgi:hypothetical protein